MTKQTKNGFVLCTIAVFATAGTLAAQQTMGPIGSVPNPRVVWSTPLFPLGGYAVNVDSYGAVGNGVHDDAPAARAAIAATPAGGTLLFSPGKTYLFGSLYTPNGPGGTLCSVYTANSIHIDLQGATVKAGSSLGPSGAMFCFWDIDGIYAYSKSKKYNTANINRGDTTITLDTPSQASTFTPGDIIYIQGETADVNDLGINQVLAANIGTGILTLAWPTGKSYTTTPMVADVQSLTRFDFSVSDGTILPGNVQVFGGAQITRSRFYNLNIFTDTSISEPFQLNDMLDSEYTNNVITTNEGPAIDFSARACTHCTATGNTLSIILSSSGAEPSFAVSSIAVSGEGSENALFLDNFMQSVGSSFVALDGLMLGGYDSVACGNTIIMGPSATGAAIDTSNHSTSPIVSANTIQSRAIYAIKLGATDLDTVTENTIVTSQAGIWVTAPALVAGGSISGMPTGYNGITIEGSTAQASVISGAKITAAVSGSSGSGIYVVHPGAQQTQTPLLTNNQILNYVIPIVF